MFTGAPLMPVPPMSMPSLTAVVHRRSVGGHGQPAPGTSTRTVSTRPGQLGDQAIDVAGEATGDEMQRPPIGAAEHAREAPLRGLHAIGDLSPFDDADALRVRRVRDPDAARFVEADAVGRHVGEVGPHRRFESVPSEAMSNAVSRRPIVSPRISVDRRG